MSYDQLFLNRLYSLLQLKNAYVPKRYVMRSRADTKDLFVSVVNKNFIELAFGPGANWRSVGNSMAPVLKYQTKHS